MDNQFAWVDFYKEFAGKLLAYKNNRGELVNKVRAIYAEAGINMPLLRKTINWWILIRLQYLVFLIRVPCARRTEARSSLL